VAGALGRDSRSVEFVRGAGVGVEFSVGRLILCALRDTTIDKEECYLRGAR
jgi:hypothetical protein